MTTPARSLVDRLDKVRGSSGSGWTARCPAHDDSEPSLSVSEGDDGRALLRCHAGCDTEDVVAALGMELSDLYPENGRPDARGWTVEDYAMAKGLPATYLRAQFGVRTERQPGKDPTVAIPYLDAAGRTVRTRYRTADRFWWGRDGNGVTLYGLDRLADANPSRSVLVVEGESDVHACAFHDVLAVGVPGASSWRSRWTRYLEGRAVYVWREPDHGGAKLVADMAADLPRAHVVEPPDGVKDPADLHRAHGDGFREVLTALTRQARPIRDVAGNLSTDSADDEPERPAGEVRVVETRAYAGIHPREVEWIWEPRIPSGVLTLLVGVPGLGKTLLAISLASRYSRGTLGPPAGNVVYATAEDSPEHTLAPRLMAADADLSRVHDVRLTSGGLDVGLTLPDDVEALRDAVEAVDAGLLVVDPLMAHLSGGIDSHRDHSIRRALAPVHRLAEETGCTPLVIGHLNKAPGTDLFRRVGGSVGLTAAARSILLMTPDPEREDDDAARVLSHGKCNLAPLAPALRLQVAPAWAEADGKRISTARIKLGEEAGELSVADVLRDRSDGERTAREEAEDYLREALAEGPQPAEKVMREAERRTGASRKTIKRARRSLNVESLPKRDEKGQLTGWTLRLPKRPEGHTYESGPLDRDGEEKPQEIQGDSGDSPRGTTPTGPEGDGPLGEAGEEAPVEDERAAMQETLDAELAGGK